MATHMNVATCSHWLPAVSPSDTENLKFVD